jgi:hypothetical protein
VHVHSLKSHADSIFTGFQKDKAGVVRLQPGTIATFTNSSFLHNSVSSGKPGHVAAGPVGGLEEDEKSCADVWFYSCLFDESNVGANEGDVSVASRKCRVYSNTLDEPAVWDLELGTVLVPWLLAPRGQSNEPAVDVFEGRRFPTEADPFFQSITAEQAAATGLPAVRPVSLPDGTDFFTQDPYAGGSKKFWTGRNIALVVGLGGTFIVLAVGVLVWYFCYFKPEGETEEFTMVRRSP